MDFDLDSLTDKDGFVNLAMEALSHVFTLVGNSRADNAASILTVLRVLLKHVEEAYKGDLTPEAARKELRKLLDAVAETDAEIDAAIKKKFGKVVE
jgi:transcription termination factor NusB